MVFSELKNRFFEKKGSKWFKFLVAEIVFFVLGRAFQSGSRHDPDMRRETAVWPEGFAVVLKVLPAGPRMVLEKSDGILRHRGSGFVDGNLSIEFKNIECAFLVLTPQIGAARAFAERRTSVRGDLADALIFTRCLNIMLAYLYPKFVCKRLLKRVPNMTLKKQFARAKIYLAGIPFGL